jgi:hypothetical protein
MGLLLSNYKHVETKIEWNHGANSNQLYRPEGSLTGGKASPADKFIPDQPASTSPATCHLAHNESELAKYQKSTRDYMANSNLQGEDEEGTNSLLLSPQRRLGSLSPFLLSSNWDESPVTKTKFSIPEDTTKTHWLHCYDQLNHLYGGPYEGLCYIIRMGDSFLREDAKDFITQFYLRWNLEDPWCRLPISNPTLKRPLTERMLKSLYCAEAIEFDSIVDPVKLRIARMLLHHYFEQLCMNSRKTRSPATFPQVKGWLAW